MANKDLKRKPHKFIEDDNIWWYEEKGGIEIHIQFLSCQGHSTLIIPWKTIRAALARKDKK